MDENISRYDPAAEFFTDEKCFINEYLNEGETGISIARARVEPGVTTKWHRLKGVVERYVIVEGRGRVEIGDLPPAEVASGDTIRIPEMTRQRIANIGEGELIFLCICSPGFTPACYETFEEPE